MAATHTDFIQQEQLMSRQTAWSMKYTVSHKKGANLVLYVTSSNMKILVPFSLLDLQKNDTWQYEFHPPKLIIVATLPCQSWNTKNACEHKFSY